MTQRLVIIVTGLPGTGKTSLAERLATDLELAFVYKDGIKERLFETLGWGEPEWSAKLSVASQELLYYFAESQLKASRSFIIESNFKPEIDTARFQALQKIYHFLPVQLHLFGQGEVLFQRVIDRTRHPGHVEQSQLEYFRKMLLEGRTGVLELEGPVFEIDTTDFEKVDYNAILAALRALV